MATAISGQQDASAAAAPPQHSESTTEPSDGQAGQPPMSAGAQNHAGEYYGASAVGASNAATATQTQSSDQTAGGGNTADAPAARNEFNAGAGAASGNTEEPLSHEEYRPAYYPHAQRPYGQPRKPAASFYRPPRGNPPPSADGKPLIDSRFHDPSSREPTTTAGAFAANNGEPEGMNGSASAASCHAGSKRRSGAQVSGRSSKHFKPQSGFPIENDCKPANQFETDVAEEFGPDAPRWTCDIDTNTLTYNHEKMKAFAQNEVDALSETIDHIKAEMMKKYQEKVEAYGDALVTKMHEYANGWQKAMQSIKLDATDCTKLQEQVRMARQFLQGTAAIVSGRH